MPQKAAYAIRARGGGKAGRPRLRGDASVRCHESFARSMGSYSVNRPAFFLIAYARVNSAPRKKTWAE